MYRRFVGVLILALFAPMRALADSEATSSTPAPVTYNPDTRPGNAYGGQVARPRNKSHIHSRHDVTNSATTVSVSTGDSTPVTYNSDTRPGSPYTQGQVKKPSRKHRKCGRCR